MSIRILTGDCRAVLRTLPAESVDCIVTSPPYYSLRDYGVTGQIGLEETPDGYVKELVEVFRECRRVLKSSGTLWLNLGDSYTPVNYGPNAKRRQDSPNSDKTMQGKANHWAADIGGPRSHELHKGCRSIGIKNKDLLGIPWMVAFALRADGWWLRQDIIWSKPNPMPESVRDRCTKAHEYIFMLSKRERYYFDAEAIAEPSIYAPGMTAEVERAPGYYAGKWASKEVATGRNDVSFKAIRETRNKRSVWEIATQPFSEAHFATFPPALIEPCIKAGCPEKCCAKCGKPWVREVERIGGSYAQRKAAGVGGPYNMKPDEYQTCGSSQSITIGFSPSCKCNAATVPGVTLDPFGGAGTTGLVADRLQRNAILIELNPAYAEMAERRLKGDGGMFSTVEVAA